MVEGKVILRVPTCVGMIADSNPATSTIFSDIRMQDVPAYVYVLRSVNDGWYYVGCSIDPRRRLIEHNSGESKSTRARWPYELVYTEEFPNLSAARKREQEIKRKKSRQYIEWLVAGRPERI
jgi:putative endonuclease